MSDKENRMTDLARPRTEAEKYADDLARDIERNFLRSRWTGAGRGPLGAWPDGRLVGAPDEH